VLVGAADGPERAYLTDFGLARHATTPSSLTGERSFVGTIDYIAPEQIRGDALDGRADQYSLACVLTECITGTPPFARDSDVATVYAHLHEPPHPIAGELPAALAGVLGRGLAKDPRDRFPTCRALVDAAAATPAAPRAPSRRRRSLAAAAAVVAAGVAAGAVALAGRDSSGGAPDAAPAAAQRASATALPLRADQVALLDPAGRKVVGEARVPGPVRDIVVTSAARWAVIAEPPRLVRLDPATGRATASVELPFAPGAAAADGAAVWVTEAGGPGLLRVEPDGRIGRRLEVAKRSGDGDAIAVASGGVWLGRGSLVLRVDPARGRVTDEIAAPRAADHIAAGDGIVWAAGSDDGRLIEIDAASRHVIARPKLHGYVTDLAVGGGSAWVTVTPEDRVYQVNPDDGSVQGAIPAGPGPESVAYLGGALLVANGRDDALSRIDLATGARTALGTGASPIVVRADAAGAASVATVAGAPPLAPVAGGNEVRVSVPDDGLSGDPATAIGPTSVQLAYLTCLRLEVYADAAGAAGRQLVPDAAAAPPVISADGRTYTWQLRDGLRFSPPSGAPITARTFAATLERALAPGLGQRAAAPQLLGDVVGVADFTAGRAAHVSGIRASGNRLTISLTQPAGDFRARLAQPFSCAVPPTTPVVADGVDGPLPTGGPYYVASQAPGRTVLERNPAYTGTRPRRPQRIVYETGVPTARAAALLGAGRVDYLPYDFDLAGALAEGGALDRSYGPDSVAARQGAQRYYRTPVPGLDLLAFNTRRPLFSDLRMRQAVSAALDRPAIAAVWHEPPSDRYVPPAVLDTPNGAAYPVGGPDLVRARRLTHGVRGTAVLYFCGAPENRRAAAVIRANLAAIGIAVRPAPSLDCVLGHDPKVDSADLMLISPATPVLDPAAFLEAAVGHDSIIGKGFIPPGWIQEPRLAADATAARPLQGAARTAAYAALQDRLLAAAPLAGLGSWTAPEYVAPRIGCRLFQGAYGWLDLAAACPAAS
jgi:serine/threonine-protein kinase